jgi:DNA invertase Pin-like site-specific DNA recombinase
MTSPRELAAVYRRVSTDKQDESLTMQEERATAYTSFRGLELRDGLTFSDPDTSGRIPIMDRTGGRALMNRLRLGDVKHLIVAKLDRIGRNTRDALGVLEFLKENHIVLHIIDFGGETISTQGHMGKLILTMLLAVAEWEAGEIRDRTTKIMRGKFEKNELTGNVPYGFDVEYVFPDGATHLSPMALSPKQIVALGHGDPDKIEITKRLVDNSYEQEIIRQLAVWRITPDGENRVTSYTKVAAYADANGWVTKQGRPWTCGAVFSVLNNRHTRRLLETTLLDRSGDGSLQTPAPTPDHPPQL